MTSSDSSYCSTTTSSFEEDSEESFYTITEEEDRLQEFIDGLHSRAMIHMKCVRSSLSSSDTSSEGLKEGNITIEEEDDEEDVIIESSVVNRISNVLNLRKIIKEPVIKIPIEPVDQKENDRVIINSPVEEDIEFEGEIISPIKHNNNEDSVKALLQNIEPDFGDSQLQTFAVFPSELNESEKPPVVTHQQKPAMKIKRHSPVYSDQQPIYRTYRKGEYDQHLKELELKSRPILLQKLQISINLCLKKCLFCYCLLCCFLCGFSCYYVLHSYFKKVKQRKNKLNRMKRLEQILEVANENMYQNTLLEQSIVPKSDKNRRSSRNNNNKKRRPPEFIPKKVELKNTHINDKKLKKKLKKLKKKKKKKREKKKKEKEKEEEDNIITNEFDRIFKDGSPDDSLQCDFELPDFPPSDIIDQIPVEDLSTLYNDDDDSLDHIKKEEERKKTEKKKKKKSSPFGSKKIKFQDIEDIPEDELENIF